MLRKYKLHIHENNKTFEFPTSLGFPHTNRIRCSIVRDGMSGTEKKTSINVKNLLFETKHINCPQVDLKNCNLADFQRFPIKNAVSALLSLLKSSVRDGKNLIPGNLLKKSYFLKIHNISLKHSKGIFISEKTK